MFAMSVVIFEIGVDNAKIDHVLFILTYSAESLGASPIFVRISDKMF